MALDFIMGFRDFNRYFVHYPSPQNELEEAINAHAREDETHSALLLKDWEALDMDATLGWRPRDLFWWLTSEWTADARRMDFELISLVWHNPDPLLRFAIIESMEAAGNVFFARTVRIIKALGDDQDRLFREFPYFGPDHFARETGHLQGGADERPFLRATLSDEDAAKARAHVEHVFSIFTRHFDSWNALARSMHDGTWKFDAEKEGRAAAVLRPDVPHDVSGALALEHPTSPSPEAAPLVQKRREAFDELWATPAYRWMRETWPGDFRRMVRYFLLQWVVDNWACADYFTFDTTYPDPKTPLERGINRLSQLYASEMRCRYTEWETLQLDEYTRWTALEALRHFWLDERVEEHREVFADLRKLTFQYPDPLYRYWILKCFVRFGDSMIRSLGVALKRGQEKEDDFAMFAGSAERMHPDLPPDPEADRAVFELERRPLTPDQVKTIDRIIEETKKQEAQRSAITWRIIGENRYDSFDRQWAEKNGGATRKSVAPLREQTAETR
ncbi:MAG: hypothetical protein KIT84_18310 [Labilithrix sp.]|nr:hypothetical protein [Labilithrix sp.]MCW5812987.1 hypothetical protein [Labilithrix sp.]